MISLDTACRGKAVDRLLAFGQPPTAVVAAESTLGRAVLNLALQKGIRMPEGLAVISFDDGDTGLITQPTMSSIHAHGEELGRLAVQNLLKRIDGSAPDRIDMQIECELLERESSQQTCEKGQA